MTQVCFICVFPPHDSHQLGRVGLGSSKDVYYDDEGYYPGIVNISGTYCFMDSTLQARPILRPLKAV